MPPIYPMGEFQKDSHFCKECTKKLWNFINDVLKSKAAPTLPEPGRTNDHDRSADHHLP